MAHTSFPVVYVSIPWQVYIVHVEIWHPIMTWDNNGNSCQKPSWKINKIYIIKSHSCFSCSKEFQHPRSWTLEQVRTATYYHDNDLAHWALITRLVWPTWGPPGSCRSQVGPMLAPWTMLSWRPSDAIWYHKSGSILTAAPSPYPNQSWFLTM